jgi:ferredoxin-NADP reductase
MAGGYDVRVLEIQPCGSDIVTLRLERPSAYSFSPGQWFTLRLQTEQGPAVETFSHCSAPADPYLEMTTRISSSAFKTALAALQPGAEVHIAGPGGRLALPAENRVAFLAGGVGITPIRSMLRDAGQRGASFEDAVLFYGNRDESCVPFLGELEALAHIGLRAVVVYERPPSGWTGESGFITAEMVRRHVDPDDGRSFVVTGPPVMVSAMETVLDELRIPGPSRIIERFGTADAHS